MGLRKDEFEDPVRPPSFLLGAFSINKLFLTPNNDVLNIGHLSVGHTNFWTGKNFAPSLPSSVLGRMTLTNYISLGLLGNISRKREARRRKKLFFVAPQPDTVLYCLSSLDSCVLGKPILCTHLSPLL